MKMKQILYLTTSGKLGVLKGETLSDFHKEKYHIVRWWHSDDVVKYLERNRNNILCPQDHLSIHRDKDC